MTREEAKREILFAKREVMADSWIDKAYDMAIQALSEPERKKGKWIFKNDTKQFFCDQCDEPSLTADDVYIYSMDFSKFCPNCGADMRGEEMSRNERNDSMRQM